MLTSCSRTAIINSIFQSSVGHLGCITILFNSTCSGTMWRKWYTCLIPAPFHPKTQKVASVSVHICTVSSEQVFHRGLYSEEGGGGGGGGGADDLVKEPRSNGLQEKRRDEEESGHWQSRSLSADKCISRVDKIRAMLQMQEKLINSTRLSFPGVRSQHILVLDQLSVMWCISKTGCSKC